MLSRVKAFLSKTVGPRTLHLLDGLAAVALASVAGELTSPAFRTFTATHPVVDAGGALALPVLVALSAKLRTAAAPYMTGELGLIEQTLAPHVAHLTPQAAADLAKAIADHVPSLTPPAAAAADTAADSPAAPTP